ncbi:MAG: FeoB-associated Cys-rich membrane protein [Pelistega sp.]|nr:FeoB-associated Cys-rich membrane protein [Pelistega sp.]
MMMDYLIIAVVFAVACGYIYYKLVKKKGCSGCASSKSCVSARKGNKDATAVIQVHRSGHENNH